MIGQFAFKLEGQNDDIVVIDDLPSDITCLQFDLGKFLIIKWVGADSEEQVYTHLSTIDDKCYEKYNMDIVFNDSNIIIFDAAWTLRDIGENVIKLNINKGRYSLNHRIYRPDDSIELHLLKFTQVG